MVDASTQLLSAYGALHELFIKQIELAEMPRYDEQIEDINELENSKRDVQILIQELRLHTADYQLISSDIKNQLVSYISDIQQLNDRLQAIINEWYREDSRSMKQVNVQRKTLQSYGGFNSNEVISYYIDSKK